MKHLTSNELNNNSAKISQTITGTNGENYFEVFEKLFSCFILLKKLSIAYSTPANNLCFTEYKKHEGKLLISMITALKLFTPDSLYQRFTEFITLKNNTLASEYN